MTTTMRTALVRTDVNCHKVVRYDDYKSQKEFAADLRGNGYKVLKIWNGDISDAEVEEWHFLHRDYDKCNTKKTDTNKKLIACIDDYSVDTDAAAEVEELNAENAKAAEKVAFFENLKETHDGKIFIDDVLEAWNLATCTLGKLKKNNTKTTNAGYTILENSVGDWVSVLDDRFEVNLTTGQTFNVWTSSASIENAKNYAWDEVEEGIFHANNADEKKFWLNVCKAKFVNSLITLGVKDLIAAEIIREEEFIACIDEYRVDVDAAAEVEIENAKNAAFDKVEFEVGKWYYDCCISASKSPAYKVTHRTKKTVTLTDDFGEIIRRKIDATSSVEKVSFNGDIMPIFLQADCFCTNAEEIQKAEDALAYSLTADNGNITVEETDPNAKLIACIDDYFVNSDDAAEVEEVNARNAVFEISKKRDAFIANVFANCGKFSIKLARSDEDRNFHLDEDGLWTIRLTEKDVGYLNELYYYEEGGKFTLALMRGLSDYNMAEYDTEEEVRKAIISLGAAVKRGEKIFTFPAARKPIIDWDAVYNDFRIEEIFNLQRDFKKFLKLGEMKRAENVFENLKDVFQKYQRRKAA